MVIIKLLGIENGKVRYMYYPEGGKRSGIVSVSEKTKERTIEKVANGFANVYALHAFKRIEEYIDKQNFLKEDMIAWY